MAMTAPELEAIEDVGPRIARTIADFFALEHNRNVVEQLRRAGVQMEIAPEAVIEPKSDRLAGKSIIISGVFTHNSRDKYKEIIEQHGGKNVGSISKKTDYVLAGENMGPAKLEKAQKLGIPILSEDDFLAMIGE